MITALYCTHTDADFPDTHLCAVGDQPGSCAVGQHEHPDGSVYDCTPIATQTEDFAYSYPHTCGDGTVVDNLTQWWAYLTSKLP